MVLMKDIGLAADRFSDRSVDPFAQLTARPWKLVKIGNDLFLLGLPAYFVLGGVGLQSRNLFLYL